MTVRDFKSVERYAKQYIEMNAMIDNLREFLATMPAPNEDDEIEGVDYGYLGDVTRVHELLELASEITYEMGE
jgi:hypothetical protein